MKRKAVSGTMLTLLLTSTLTLAFSIELVSATIPPEPEYPAIYVDPPIVENIMPPNNFTISIKTNYDGTDIWVWQFTLAYNTSVLHGGIQGKDVWTGDNATSTFNMTKKPVVPDSGVVYVNETLMTRETEGNDTWTGDGVTKTFDMTKKPVVPDSEVLYVNETLMARETEGNDTWTGDGVTKKFYTTHKPLVEPTGPWEDIRVYVNGEYMFYGIHYTVDYCEGIIEFKDDAIPADGAKVEAKYHYGHYNVDYSEGKIEFYDLAIPADGVEIEATYQYVQYTVDYAEGSITFTTAPSEEAKIEVAYLYGGVANGDLITKEKHDTAIFAAGTFNNTSGKLSLTYAFFFYIVPPIPVTYGPGTLANVTFTVVGTGTSNITLVKPHLGGAEDGDTYIIIDAETMPDQIGHGYFGNTAPPPAVTATIDMHGCLNLKSKGKWITANIELPENYNVGDIDVSEVLLNDEVPVESSEVAWNRLIVKFDRSKVIALLLQAGEVELTVTGNFFDGTRFEGSDTIRVIGQ